MLCVSMSDPGMLVLPTHRLFRGVPAMSSDDLIQRLGSCFEVERAGSGPELARELWQRIEMEGDQGTLGLYTHADQSWVVARISQNGRDRLAAAAPDHCDQWRALGVSILHRLIMDELIGATDLPKPMYVHDTNEVTYYLQQGDLTGRDATGQEGQGGVFPLAAMVMPASLDDVRAISEMDERMPAKSTFFFPKALSGLVCYALS